MPKVRPNKYRRAFTTIELLTAIGILVVLVGIVFFGYRSVIGGSKKNATHLALENCRAMLAEREAVSGLGAGPLHWVWQSAFVDIEPPPPNPNPNDLNYWKVPYRNPLTSAGAPLPVDSPAGFVKDDPSSLVIRNSSEVVVNTTLMMSIMAAVPANRTTLGKIPKDQLFTPKHVSGAAYAAGSRVMDTAGIFYVALQDNTAASTTTAEWQIDPTPVPMLQDGWKNPIIFVPASGLRVNLQAANNWIIISPEGQVNNNGLGTAVVSRIGRPFFASAGPDGSFIQGDDNVYSFEK